MLFLALDFVKQEKFWTQGIQAPESISQIPNKFQHQSFKSQMDQNSSNHICYQHILKIQVPQLLNYLNYPTTNHRTKSVTGTILNPIFSSFGISLLKTLIVSL